jgi:chemotaxis protein CheD
MANRDDAIIIGIGEHHTGSKVMTSIGLGSCVGLIIYDKEKNIGSFAHVMLPKSQGKAGERPGKFADTAVEILLQELEKAGSKRSSLVAKLAGGASMFQHFSGNLNIGERNIIALEELLIERKIPILKKDVGGSVGRTVTFYPIERGKVVVKQGDGIIKVL